MNSITKSILHAVVSALLFIIPLVLSSSTGWQDLTLGAILNFVYLHLVALKAPTA